MADEQRRERIKVTNNAPGPRTILTSTGGETLQKGESKTLLLTENDYKALKPYIDLGHFQLSEPDPEEDVETINTDLGGEDTTGNPVEGAKTLGVDIVPVNQVEEPEGDEPNGDEPEGDEPDSTDGEFGEDSRESQGQKPTHIEHRGFGRWYGMLGEDRVTPAMNETEADAYAEEHGIVKKAAKDPSNEDAAEDAVEEAPAETPPADETAATES